MRRSVSIAADERYNQDREDTNMDWTRIKKQRLLWLAALFLTTGTIAQNIITKDWTLEYSNVSNGYSHCTYQDNMDGTSTVGVTINYNNTQGHLGLKNYRFLSRGVMVYNYDKNGAVQNDLRIAEIIYMDDTPYNSRSVRTSPISYSMYGFSPSHPNGRAWHNENAQTVRVKIILHSAYFEAWPALGVRAGNITYDNDVAEIKGLAYIGTNSQSGICEVIINPEIPPPPDPKITMTAPDWELGELTQGTPTEKPFSSAPEQLCFAYDYLKLAGLRYAINATNQNGLSGNGLYQLRHLTSPSDTVPYRVVLRNASSNTQVDLPNNRNVVSILDNSGRECFDPTFHVETPKGAKEGDYSDVLTFTVVAQP